MRLSIRKSASLFSFALCMLLFVACSENRFAATPTVPSLPLAQEVTSTQVPKGTMKLVSGPMNSTLSVMNSGKEKDSFYYEAEAALSPDSFTRLKSEGGSKAVSDMINKSLDNLKTVGIIPIKTNADVGYFSFWVPYHPDLLAAIKSVSLPTTIYINPRNYDVKSLKQMTAFTAQSQGFTPRAGNTNLSGLELLHAPEFVKLAEKSLKGAKVDGSSVRIGITDTGITYNHPTFLSADLKTPRITYMKDFTREGRVYFNPAAKFSAVLTDDKNNIFTVQAEYNETPTLPAMPDPTVLKPVKDLQITVSDELKAILQNPKKQVSLSYLNEATFQGGDNPVDINANGTLDDQIPVLLVIDTDTKDAKVYADFTVQNDFTTSVAQGDFNATGDTAKVFAEKIAFNIQDDTLITPDQTTTVNVKSASIVGYDAGPHGTHVAGIAAGRKTISNDSDNTLARGVAPEAQILSDRICANNGGCNDTDAMIDIVVNGHADVVNMSIGSLSPFNDGYGVDETILNRLSSIYGVTFMVAAGNDGPGRQTVSSPSVARFAMSIGAAASRALIQSQYQWPGMGSVNPSSPQTDEFMLYFSSRGPTASGGFKPNISAPGTELSSVQLNAAPGTRSGLDVYWGTSMATPSASGSYALLLDAVKKYNLVHKDAPLPSDAATLRTVLIQSARVFGKNQYTWMDEGTGMIDLVAAWKLLLDIRTENFASGVKDSGGNNVALDYEVVTNLVANPTGTAYNGTRSEVVDQALDTVPAFGSGIYLTAAGTNTIAGVYVQRRLPEVALASSEAGDLSVALETSEEEFSFKTDFGADAPWVKPGVINQPNCMDSQTANLRILGRGNEIQTAADGTGTLNPINAASLYVCIDRAKLATMAPGDHGALIYAYKTDGKKTSKIPSFIIPVSITIPMKTLVDNTAYDVTGTVNSFQVARNYVSIPAGATLVRITLEVPALTKGAQCSEVMLLSLEGGNTITPPEASLIANNCTSNGSPADAASRTLVLNRSNPLGGIWDLHVFGLYNYPQSQYHLRVDYLMSGMSVTAIAGDSSKLNGSFDWTLGKASITALPDATASTYTLTSLYHRQNSQVANGAQTIVDGPLGQFRQYPAGTTDVAIDTGGSPGNDIDLMALECDTPDASSCQAIAQSGTPTDVEHVDFVPKAGKYYAIVVPGYDVKDAGNFFCDEHISLASESGTIAISADATSELVTYSFGADAVASSVLLNYPLFTSKQYQVTGSIVLKSKDGLTLGTMPITIGL